MQDASAVQEKDGERGGRREKGIPKCSTSPFLAPISPQIRSECSQTGGEGIPPWRKNRSRFIQRWR